jgi:hypothetical protein
MRLRAKRALEQASVRTKRAPDSRFCARSALRGRHMAARASEHKQTTNKESSKTASRKIPKNFRRAALRARLWWVGSRYTPHTFCRLGLLCIAYTYNTITIIII